MPLSAAAGTALAAGISTIGNVASTGNMNRKNRRFSREMYQRQKQDNIEFWRMQNAYNDPSQQMARMKAAGLNPALMYQQGNTGNAGSIQSASAMNPQTKAPTFDQISSVPQMIAGIRSTNATTNLTEQQIQVKNAEEMLKLAQTAGQSIKNAQGEFDLELAKDTRESSLQAAQAYADKLSADAKFRVDENERAMLLTANTLKQGFESILTSRLNRAKTKKEMQQIQKNIDYLRENIDFRRLEKEMLSRGQSLSDPLWQRWLGVLLGDPSTVGNNIKKRARKWRSNNKNPFMSGLYDGLTGWFTK